MLSSRLRKYITVELIKSEPKAQQLHDAVSEIMLAADISPTQDNFFNLVVPECIAIATELDKTVKKDIFDTSLDNLIKPLLKASLAVFPLTIAPRKASEEKKEEKAPEADKGPAAIPDAPSSGPGPINFNVNYVRYPTAAELQKRKDAIAAAAKKRREEEEQNNRRLLRNCFLSFCYFMRENVVHRNALQQELMQLGNSIKTQYDVWNNDYLNQLGHETVPIPEQLKKDVATHDTKYAEYKRFIYNLYSNGKEVDSYFKKHDLTQFAFECSMTASTKQMIQEQVASEERIKIAIANPYSQEAFDIRMAGAAYMAESRAQRAREEQEAKRQEALRQEEEESFYHSSYRQTNYR